MYDTDKDMKNMRSGFIINECSEKSKVEINFLQNYKSSPS